VARRVQTSPKKEMIRPNYIRLCCGVAVLLLIPTIPHCSHFFLFFSLPFVPLSSLPRLKITKNTNKTMVSSIIVYGGSGALGRALVSTFIKKQWVRDLIVLTLQLLHYPYMLDHVSDTPFRIFLFTLSRFLMICICFVFVCVCVCVRL
jgi:hypothetical protein